MNSTCLYLEFGQRSLKALLGGDGLELSIERAENGRLTEACKERLKIGLRDFLLKKNWQSRVGAFCAIGARGVSLRRMNLPAGNKDAIEKLLRLQIERDFPLSPDELAWGYSTVNGVGQGDGGVGHQELLVVAVKKESIAEFTEVLSASGIEATFALAALTRGNLAPRITGTYAVLDIGLNHSELTSFENGEAVSLRILPWGGETMTQAIRDRLNVTRDEAEKLKIHSETNSAGELGKQMQAATSSALDMLAAAVKSNWNGQRLYVSGKSTRQKDFAALLGRALGGRLECERLEIVPGEGRSSATIGLKKACEQGGGEGILVIQSKQSAAVVKLAQPRPWKWAAAAAVLVLCVVLFPYIEALLLKPRLAKKLAEINGAKARLAAIDDELNFLQYLKLNQPPYVDATYVLANAAPNGTKFESFSMNHHGDIAMRGSMQGSQQVVEFRSKLIKSGFFSTVTVEEQTPTQDRQKVNVRITALWKPAAERSGLNIGPSAEEIEKAKSAAKGKKGGGMPGGGGGGLPPGFSLPPGVSLPPGFVMPTGD